MPEPAEYGLTATDVRTLRWLVQRVRTMGLFDGGDGRPQIRPVLVKTDAAHAKGATGTVSIYSGTKGSETDTGENIEGVYNRFADLATGKWALAFPVDSGWELWAGEC